MKIKARRRYEMAVEISANLSKKHWKSVSELMMLPKREFVNLYNEMCAFLEADDALGDMNP